MRKKRVGVGTNGNLESESHSNSLYEKKPMRARASQSKLVELICRELAPRFTPRAKLIHVGDIGGKPTHFNREYLAKVGVAIIFDERMPDVILHYARVNWLVLVDAVPSHGPINPKRRAELQTIFSGSTAGLVFVSAFLDKKAFKKYLSEISWKTEVWIADSPSHLVHFGGERLLGPA
jgi:hypothetical protein